jgi:ring-1,2-phenylacetyl-CoA epoxidase subunit PaaB
MNTYEVFLKKDGKEEFRHVGSMQAPDAEMALPLARETYARRAEGDAMWLVDRTDLLVADPALLAPNADKPHRHNDGMRVAARRKAQRTSQNETT